MIYKKYVTKNGTKYARIGGGKGLAKYRWISKDDVPENLLKKLENADEVASMNCVFCNTESKLSRFVNGEAVAICEEHYYNTTLGQIAQQVRINSESQNEKETPKVKESQTA